ncbi:aldo/keto reductase [Agreia sp. VKM Ac-1783]|uniref:aldo/keto reductase n=1 Tax=Agreia sp. VKM Ac-1783 TaxID=1938889 RepID=UPI000A2ABFEB|nr:aldo/keto reductase [Agreia sp. VKM Ac-1783]SMQ67969.1 Predicted oxidoreductase [Agreia sp. VKM Ac-1783]
MTPNNDATTSTGTPPSRFRLAIDGNVFGWASGVSATAEALDAFHAAGGRLISTADHYAGGRSEIMIGNWVRSRKARSRVFLATKIGRHPDAPGLSADDIVTATEASLERLQTDHLDLLSFDGEHPHTPLEESLAAASELIASGKVRALAASAYSGARLLQARQLADDNNLPRFRAVFSPYSLMTRRPVEHDLLPAVRSLNIGIFARLPLANGFLTGNYRVRADVPESSMFADAASHVGRDGFRVLKALEQVAAEQNVSLAACALAWVRSKPNVIAPVVRAASAEQVAELVASPDLVLEPHQLMALDRASE